MHELKELLRILIPKEKERIKHLVQNYSHVKVSEVTIKNVFGGLRGVRCLPYDLSSVDPDEGVQYRGIPIKEVIEQLPRAEDGIQPLPEGVYYLLMTGKIPSIKDVRNITEDWRNRAEIPSHIFDVLDAMPSDTHPMTLFSLGILALRPRSKYKAAYNAGASRVDLWEPAYEDVMDLLAKLPTIAAYIYRKHCNQYNIRIEDSGLDWAANYASMMGINEPDYMELMRLTLSLHADHEGGNLSAHTGILVGSGLADPFSSLSSALNGLSGPLHGAANQEALIWILDLWESFGRDHIPTDDELRSYVWDTLNAGRVVPGFGHAVLRKTDPRYLAQREFALQHLPDDPLFQIVSALFKIVPEVLKEHGKAANPYPNVDAHSGSLQYFYGVRQHSYFTVLFGVSRAIGILAWYVWARALQLPIERPKSITLDYLESLIQ
jgi:citrate synthase